MILVWAALAGCGLWLFVSGLPESRVGLRHRIKPYAGAARLGPGGRTGPVEGGLLERALRSVTGVMVPRADLARRLRASGTGLTLDAYRLQQIAWGFCAATAAVAVVVAVQAAGGGIDLRVLPLLAAIVFVAGFLARDWWLSRQVDKRYARLRDELPAAIDLITLSIMAGESVATACGRVAQAITGGIGEEFQKITADVRGGRPLIEALEDFAVRVPEVGVARFVDALCVGIEKGAPLADTLRAQADDGREARRRYLLELGGRREILMLVPVVFLIMPVVVVFALYPGLVTLELLVP